MQYAMNYINMAITIKVDEFFPNNIFGLWMLHYFDVIFKSEKKYLKTTVTVKMVMNH